MMLSTLFVSWTVYDLSTVYDLNIKRLVLQDREIAIKSCNVNLIVLLHIHT